MIIAEGGASYRDPWTWSDDKGAYAAYQIEDFYTYLPMRYPNIKMALYFSHNADGEPYAYRLSERPEMLNAYKKSIQSKFYLTDVSEGANLKEYYYPVYGSEISPTVQELDLYVKYAKDRQNGVGKVEYLIDGSSVGTASQIPYSVSVDFSPYSGKSIEITANAYDPWGNLIKSKRFSAIVK